MQQPQQQLPGSQIKEVHTRFLFPCFFDQWSLDEATERLQAQTFSRGGASGSGQAMWQCNPPAGLYQDEVLEHVTRFLFREGSHTCRYLKLSGNVLNSIFHHGVLLQLSSGVTLPVKPSKTGVELFLMSHGVGLLSLALTLARDAANLDEVIEFNYKLARYNPMPAAELRVPHPELTPEWAARIPDSERASIPKPPASDAPRNVRLGALGGAFRIPEVIDEILVDPLKDLNCRSAQQGLSAYTVVRFSSEVDFSDAEVKKGLNRFLSALVQVEEPGHAGAVEGEGRLTTEVLNSKHWTAVGLLSAVHLVADQANPDQPDKEHPFNDQRVPRVRDKYFIPFLMASLQKMFLERTMREASAYMEFSLEPQMRNFLRKLRAELSSSLVSAGEQVFRQHKHDDHIALQLALNNELLAAATMVLKNHRSSQGGSVSNQDKNQVLTFIAEDFKRTIVDELDQVFLHADGHGRKFLRKECKEALKRAVDDVSSQHKHFARQLDDVLQFAVQGHFVQVSSRQVLHRFYRLAQQGLDIPDAWKEVSYAISNLDRKLSSERQQGMAKAMTDNLFEISRVQRAVHVLEYVIIGVYATEVFHIFTSHDHAELPFFSYPVYVLFALMGGVLLAVALNFIFERLFERNEE